MNAVAPIPSPALSNEYYNGIFAGRVRRLIWLREDPTRWIDLRHYYRTHLADFINDWGVTVDPRNIRKGLPTVMPFVLDKRQREWCEFTFKNWQDGEYAGTEKSRDVGVSWLLCGMSIGWCTLYDGMTIGWGSFKQEKVDHTGDMGSMFEKGRAFMDGLPNELCAGYRRNNCSFERQLIFPQTKAAIIGEIGDNVGRGNRTSVYFVDETCYFEHDQLIDAALSKTTDCRQDVSSVKGMANSFAQRMHDGKSRKFTFHWKDNPRFTADDYAKFLDQWGPVITAQELDINYQASVEGVVIPAEWVNDAIDAHLKLKIEPTGEKSAAFDVADLGIDKNAFGARHGILLEYAEQFPGAVTGDIYASVEKVFLLCDLHGCQRFWYDADGLGAGVRGDARKINEAREERNDRTLEVREFRGSGAVERPEASDIEGRQNKDLFENRKAQGWWALRKRFQTTHRAIRGGAYDPSDIISIASDFKDRAQLCMELSRPVYQQSKSGKLMINKAPDGVASPNLADMVMMLYSASRGMVISDEIFEEAPYP